MTDSSNRNQRIKRLVEARKLVRDAGIQNDPYSREMVAWVTSPLGDGRHSEKFFHRLQEHVHHQALLDELEPRTPHIPKRDPRTSVVLGHAGSEELRVSLEDLSRGLMELGPMGSGKTTHAFWVAMQLIEQGVSVFVMDHKNEARRMMKLLPGRVLIVRPVDLWFNALAPLGDDSGAFYGAFAQELGAVFQMHASTVMKVSETLRQLSQGTGPGDPHPSLQDLWLTLEHRSKKTKDRTYQSAATALRNLEPFFGRGTRLRENRRSPTQYPMVALECLGLPPRIVRFIAGIFLNRLQHETRSKGHRQTGLNRVYLSDEGSFEFSAQFADTGSSVYLSPQRKLFTQARSSRTCVAVGFQTLGQADPVVKTNAGTFVCHLAAGGQEQREAASLLGLPLDQAPNLGRLPLGRGYLRAHGYPEPVPFTFPHFNLGDYPSDEALERVMRPQIEDLLSEAIYAPIPNNGEPLSYRSIIGETPDEPVVPEEEAEPPPPLGEVVTPDVPLADWLYFLDTLRQREPLAVTSLYKAMGCSAGRGNRLKKDLLHHGLIADRNEKPDSKKGGRPKKLLSVTPRGHEFLEKFGSDQAGTSE